MLWDDLGNTTPDALTSIVYPLHAMPSALLCRFPDSRPRLPKLTYGTRHSLLSQILFISFAPPPSLHCTEHVYIHTYRLYMNYRETFLHISERCEVLTGYLSLGCRSGGDWTNTGHWTRDAAIPTKYRSDPSVQKRTRLACPSR